MSDATRLRKSAAQLFALSLSTDDKEWAAQLAMRASDYLTRAEEIERETANVQKPETT